MAKQQITAPIVINQSTARRFILAHQYLWPPRQLQGKEGVLEFIRHVNCIQYDPIKVAGTNPDLVLQARVHDYSPDMLDELRYTDRTLLDGWDKVASIYPVEDWPYFARQRNAMQTQGRQPQDAIDLIPYIIETIRERGALSSIDLKNEHRVDWYWGPTSVTRAALEYLYAVGKLGIHHRVGTRRYFDLIENLIPSELIEIPDPNKTLEIYHDWHVLRRVKSMGLAHPGAGEHWLGIRRAKSSERKSAVWRLIKRGELNPVLIEEIPNQTFYIQSEDIPKIENLKDQPEPQPRMAFIAPLDNLIWDRRSIEMVFEFKYIWEVYKPEKQRQYGYYVLPVLYGENFVGRVEPKFDQKTRTLQIKNWWWEPGFIPDQETLNERDKCIQAFGAYLGAEDIQVF